VEPQRHGDFARPLRQVRGAGEQIQAFGQVLQRVVVARGFSVAGEQARQLCVVGRQAEPGPVFGPALSEIGGHGVVQDKGI
jgi:hypothetical protein